MRGLFTLVGACLCAATTAKAQSEESIPKDERAAVAVAKAAFEFRDFKKAVDTLKPWVRPMRIRNEDLKIEARALMGICLHLLTDVQRAKEEFGELLLLDPRHELDPFVVPPQVIATFEAVRTELRPTLDQILKERGDLPENTGPTQLKLVTVPHPITAWAPFGIGQFVLDKPGWGVAFALLQSLGLIGNVSGFLAGNSVDKSDPSFDRWVGLQYGALAVAVLAYAGSVIHGILALDQYEKNQKEQHGTTPSIRWY